MTTKVKIDKYIEYATTKIKIMYKERKFFSSGYRLKYILEKSANDTLIVVFSGIPRPGIKARYNYNRTLNAVDANKLFILDDFGHDERGAYYLGKNRDFKIQEAVKKLIDDIKQKLGIKRTFYVGSSKGGYAALYFGIEDEGSTIIAGSLQYLLGSYITSNERLRDNLMSYVMGKDYTDDDVTYLNSLLQNKIKENRNNRCSIHLHYSDQEYTYEDHMIHLINDLKELGIEYTEDIGHYEKHRDLSLHFPLFLVKMLKRTI